MFWHDFLGSLADNMVEVNWMLVVTLFPVMVGTDDIVAMFGLTDTVWVVFTAAGREKALRIKSSGLSVF